MMTATAHFTELISFQINSNASVKICLKFRLFFMFSPDAFPDPSAYKIIFFGHFSAQAPQFVHFFGSICAMLSSTFTAPASQTLSHILHPIQPTEHAFMTSLPLSLELHCTRCFCE